MLLQTVELENLFITSRRFRSYRLEGKVIIEAMHFPKFATEKSQGSYMSEAYQNSSEIGCHSVGAALRFCVMWRPLSVSHLF